MKIERNDTVAIVTIDGAPWNIMTMSFIDELEVAVSDIAKVDAVRTVVITAAGETNFSAGMDLKK